MQIRATRINGLWAVTVIANGRIGIGWGHEYKQTQALAARKVTRVA
jgi:hypothetical protein